MSGRLKYGWYCFPAILLAIACGCEPENGDDLLGGIVDPGNTSALDVYTDEFTADDAYHLLRRATLGATPDEVTSAVASGVEATVDALLTKRNELAKTDTLAASYEDDIPRRWMVYLLQGRNPLNERMAMFWHDRFAASRRVLDNRDRNLAIQHWQMLRTNALGNYREFLEALTLDPLMLIWLDGANSPKQDPNENYAREFWELFTLGRDVLYTEDDIREAARAFTGITLLRENGIDARPIFDLINHDETIKTIFPDRAEALNYNYQTVISLTLAQAEAAKYVARNLFVFFIHDHPTDEQVDVLADLFVASDFEIAPLVRKLLVSKAFFSEDARGNQVTTPVEHVVGVDRTFGATLYSEDSQGFVLDRLVDDLAAAGMDLLNPPGVNGWDEDLSWLEDQWVISRVRGLGRTLEYGPERTPDLPYHLLPKRSTWDERETRGKIVDAIAGVFHLKLTEEEKTIYIEVLDQDGYLAFYLENPDNQPRHVQELIRLMAMHEDVIGR